MGYVVIPLAYYILAIGKIIQVNNLWDLVTDVLCDMHSLDVSSMQENHVATFVGY